MDQDLVTKKDLAEFKAELKAEFKIEIAALREEFNRKLDERFDKLQEKMRDNQTELLRAFIPFQETVTVRFKNIEVNANNNDTALKLRLETPERRVNRIENKVFLEPPAEPQQPAP